MMNMTDSVESESEPKAVEIDEVSELLASQTIDSPRFVSDVIKVVAIPEKRGGFLKHTEYEVS
jgi:hypothetical protein